MKKAVTILAIVSLATWPVQLLATNTHAIDLEVDSHQFLSITDASQVGLDITGDLTLEAWTMFESVGNGDVFLENPIVVKYDVSSQNRAYGMGFHDNGTISCFASDDGSGNNSHYLWFNSDAAGVSLGAWTHLACAFDIAGDNIDIYVDGSEVASTQTGSGIGASIFNSSAPLTIGATMNLPSYFETFDGLIDDVRVWSVFKTAEEIAASYNVELCGDETNLQGYWRLDNTLTDLTTNTNDLTNNNSATFSIDIPVINDGSCAGAVVEQVKLPLPIIHFE